MLLQDLKEFSQETSIHGLGQIADDAATKTKRFLWIIIFVGSLSYAGVMLHDAYHGGYTLCCKCLLSFDCFYCKMPIELMINKLHGGRVLWWLSVSLWRICITFFD